MPPAQSSTRLHYSLLVPSHWTLCPSPERLLSHTTSSWKYEFTSLVHFPSPQQQHEASSCRNLHHVHSIISVSIPALGIRINSSKLPWNITVKISKIFPCYRCFHLYHLHHHTTINDNTNTITTTSSAITKQITYFCISSSLHTAPLSLEFSHLSSYSPLIPHTLLLLYNMTTQVSIISGLSALENRNI